MALSTYGKNLHLDAIYGSGSPASFYMAVMFTAPTSSTTGSTLDEPTAASYARPLVANSAAMWPAASGGSKSNLQEVEFASATEHWGTLQYWAFVDAATAGNILIWGSLTSRLVSSGRKLKIPVGGLTITAR